MTSTRWLVEVTHLPPPPKVPAFAEETVRPARARKVEASSVAHLLEGLP